MENALLLKGKPSLPERQGAILVIQLGDIGDAVLTLPLVKALTECFSDRELVICVREHAREVMEDCPFVGRVISVNKQKRSVKDFLAYQARFVWKLRRQRFAMAIELRTGTRGALIARLSGAKTRIGRYANDGKLWRNRLFTHLVKPTLEHAQYAARHSLNIMAPFRLKAHDDGPRISVPEHRMKKADVIFKAVRIPKNKPLVAVHPFSLWQYKEWPNPQMAALLDHIQARYGCSVVVTGAPNESARANKLIQICTHKPFNLAGKTSIGELSAVLKKCDLFLGVDTAALHMAAAVGVPTVGIFGPSSWINWAPREENHLTVQKRLPCQPCSQKGCDGSEKSRCLDELTAREVIEAAGKMFDRFLKNGA